MVDKPMQLTGPEKAVLLLLSLDESTAAPIMSELDPSDVRKLREVAAMMRAVPASALDRVYAEFVDDAHQAIAVPRGGIRYLRRVATRALGESRTQEIFDEAPATAMDRIAAMDPTVLGGVLENEHPQVVAAILSQLPADKAAKLVEALPEGARAAALTRLGSMTEVPAGLLEEVATALSEDLPPPGVEASLSVDGIGKSAQLVRKLKKETSEGLLTEIEGQDSQLVAAIRRNMYSFEDLAAIDQRAMRELLKAVPGDRLTLALKTASEQLRNHLFSGMSKRAADRVKEDLDLLGAVRLSDVEEAQREIVEIALRLESEGVLSLGSDADAMV
ncbi:MAG TPA: flagellar motor switch protein FliG [Minicystis sp.]|nr:flagellar motor switch protein FliG [Polyangiaceae bacterium]HVY47461.1 flagellar motor switch protein FliG [Minicystis sp.]